MPVRSLGHGCYRWGAHGKKYCGPGARQKAEKQGRAAYSRGYRSKETTMSTDRSSHPTVVEYAVQTMIKRGKSPSAAAKDTVKKHHGTENMFFGPGPTEIDATALENALWDRMVEATIRSMGQIKEGKEHYALDGTLQHFNQKQNVRAELKKRVIEKLGRDPFTNDDAPPALKEKVMAKSHDNETSAESAGAAYAQTQLGSDYFMDWVRDQIHEASQMPPEDVLPLKTKSDAKKVAGKMLQQLEWDAKKDMRPAEISRLIGDEHGDVADFWEGFHETLTGAKDWLADEILAIEGGGGGVEAPRHSDPGPTSLVIDGGLEARRLKVGGPSKTLSATTETWVVHHQGEPGKSVLQVDIFKPRGQPWAAWTGNFTRAHDRKIAESVAAARNGSGSVVRAPRTMRDYIAVDRRGRTIGGPFKSYSDAKSAAGTAGTVQFVRRTGESSRSPKAVRSASRYR